MAVSVSSGLHLPISTMKIERVGVDKEKLGFFKRRHLRRLDMAMQGGPLADADYAEAVKRCKKLISARPVLVTKTAIALAQTRDAAGLTAAAKIAEHFTLHGAAGSWAAASRILGAIRANTPEGAQFPEMEKICAGVLEKISRY